MRNDIYKVVATGSKGNCVIYHTIVCVDIGVSFEKIKPFIKDLKIVLLTHEHKDHINVKTLRKIQEFRPSLRVGCCDWMVDKLEGIRNIDIYEVGKEYDYNIFKIFPIKLYHNVLNCGYRIFKEDFKIIHCTDTAHLEGIAAKNYNLYAIEHNYDEETIYDIIKEKERLGGFAYEKGAINSHLSKQKAEEFIFKNKGKCSKVLRLHESENK